MTHTPIKSVEPYRVLFPIGILSGLWGVSQWIFFGTGLISGYPSNAHPDSMMGGFLFAFVAGFLMTAVPRFTGSFSASPWETLIAAVLVVLVSFLSGILLWRPDARAVSLSVILVQGIWLAIFCMRRFVQRHHEPPSSFVFVGLGLLFSIVGPLLLLLSSLGWASAEVGLLGRAIFYHGMILSLVIGVGSRLVPAFLGHAAQPMVQLILKKNPSGKSKSQLSEMVILALLFLVSFPLETWGASSLGRGLRALVVAYVAVAHWKLHRAPKTKGALAFWLRICGGSLAIGMWIYALLPDYSIHMAHLVFIAGFTLLVVLIATRVTLSHGGYDMDLEKRSPVLHWTGALLLIAAVARATAFLMGQSYVLHLVYSAVIWIVALLIWAIFSLPKMLCHAPETQKPS